MIIGIVVDNEFDDDIRLQNELKVIGLLGFQVYVLCFDFLKKGHNDKRYPQNVQIIRLRFPRKVKNVLYALQNVLPFYRILWQFYIRRMLVVQGVTVLHVHDLYMASPAHAAISSSGMNVKLVLDLHENYPEAIKGYKWANGRLARMIVRPALWQKLEFSYLMMADWIVVLSESFRDELKIKYDALDKSRLVVYPNVPDVESLAGFPISEKYGAGINWPVIFYFGAIAERRGIFTLIDAAELLSKQGVNIVLLLVGPIDQAEKKRFEERICSDFGIHHIQYFNWLDISEFPSLVNASRICISPILKNKQHESGVANKVFQYMLFSKPLIVSDCGPQARLVVENDCGLVFASGDPFDLSEKVKYLLQNPEIAQMYGVNGHNCILNKFNTQIAGSVLVDLYKHLSTQ